MAASSRSVVFRVTGLLIGLLCRPQDLKQSRGGTNTTPVSKLPYRQVTKKDLTLWELVQENLELLEACPEDLGGKR
jgi:hypothetical protein